MFILTCFDVNMQGFRGDPFAEHGGIFLIALQLEQIIATDFLYQLFRDSADYVEIREIGAQGTRQYFLTLDELTTYSPPTTKNIYFGVYSRARHSGKTQDCLTTGTIWADYDTGMEDLSVMERVAKVKAKLKAVGMPEPSVMISSGNGIHVYWLLQQRAGDEALAIVKALAVATGSDPRATDKARIMRLPGTWNVKDPANPLQCELLYADYSKRYTLDELGQALEPFISQDIHSPTEPQERASKRKTEALGVTADRPCIEAILQGVPAGERNFALGRLTKWLQVKGLARERAMKTILNWNRLNRPPEEERKLLSAFHGYWYGDYKLLGCRIDEPLSQQLIAKYCNRSDCDFLATIGNIELHNASKYNNRLLNHLHALTGNDLIVYGLLVRHSEGLTTSQLTDKLTSRATGEPCMSNKTMRGSIDTLSRLGYVEITAGNRRAGKEHFYKAIPQGTYGLGYTLVSNGAITGAIAKQVTPGELRLYVLLLTYAYNKGSCYPSLATMAKELRTTPQNINYLMRGLEAADYVKREYVAINGTESLNIRLLI